MRIRRAFFGGVTGLIAAIAAHALVLGARRLTGDADIWLKGGHGPPFFELALATGAFFALVASALAPAGRGRLKAAGLAGAASFLGIVLPMGVGTRVFAWGEGASEPTWAWIYLVVGSYGAACALGAFGVGWTSLRWRGGLRGLAGVLAAWVVDKAVQWALLGRLDPMTPMGLLPPPAALLSGGLWGVGLGLSLPSVLEVVHEADNGDSVGDAHPAQRTGAGAA